MRLLDRILSDGFTTHHRNVPEEMNKWLTSSLGTAQLVVIDNVASYHFQEYSQNTGDKSRVLDVSDFPNVMLPFESTFLEMRVRNNTGFLQEYEECGVLASMVEKERISTDDLNDSLARAQGMFLQGDVRYMLTLFFFEYKRGSVKKPELSGSFMFPVNAEGQIVVVDGKFPIAGTVYPPPDYRPPPGKTLQEINLSMVGEISKAFLAPCFLALSFMHCRNVSTLTEQPPPKLSKIHERRSGRPLLRYHILQIDHMKQVLEKEGHASSLGLKQALHICRGHFKHYGRDGKGLLFGKYAATVWAPMHARGSAEHGIVVKDYDVK
jgi:hypothetical protein